MTGPDWAWLALGAALASPARYWAGVVAGSTDRRPFPLGTFVVNCSACLLLGIALKMRAPQDWVQALLAAGVCGALSTWSTLAWETIGFLRTGRHRLAARYLGTTVLAGVALAWTGAVIGQAVW
ncbi:fluoride efflux transporter FluC [Streptomyces anulatus]|uniref:fluoride efflux transporter FluC n=1 Tax=Streptomyces anulatus TaxID=1892 RepID=UPI00367C6248